MNFINLSLLQRHLITAHVLLHIIKYIIKTYLVHISGIIIYLLDGFNVITKVLEESVILLDHAKAGNIQVSEPKDEDKDVNERVLTSI